MSIRLSILVPVVFVVAISIGFRNCADADTPKGAGRHSIPSPLRKAFESRMKPRSGYFKYRVHFTMPPTTRTIDHFEQRFAGDNFSIRELLDPDGIRLRDPLGQPRLGVAYACRESQIVFDRALGQVFGHVDSADSITLSDFKPNGPFVQDIRTVGLFYTSFRGNSPLEALGEFEKPDPIREFTEETLNGGVVRVQCRSIPQRASREEAHVGRYSAWTINPAQDWSITEYESYELSAKGERQFVCTMEVENVQVDGYWWPKRVQARCESTGYEYRVEFDEIELDRADHPARIDADSLGLPIGVPVFGAKFVGQHLPMGRHIGGGVVVSEEEWQRTKENYDVRGLSSWIRAQHSKGEGSYPSWWHDPNLASPSDKFPTILDAWEIYVRRWIAKHSSSGVYRLREPLTEKQRNAAWAILEDSRKAARPIADRIQRTKRELKEKIDTLEKEIVAATNDRDRKERNGGASKMSEQRLFQAKSDLLQIEKPSEEIELVFGRLKSRLEGLLTARQASADNIMDPALEFEKLPPGRHQINDPSNPKRQRIVVVPEIRNRETKPRD